MAKTKLTRADRRFNIKILYGLPTKYLLDMSKEELQEKGFEKLYRITCLQLYSLKAMKVSMEKALHSLDLTEAYRKTIPHNWHRTIHNMENIIGCSFLPTEQKEKVEKLMGQEKKESNSLADPMKNINTYMLNNKQRKRCLEIMQIYAESVNLSSTDWSKGEIKSGQWFFNAIRLLQ